MKSFGVTIQMNPLWQNIFLVIFISWDFYENRFENFVFFSATIRKEFKGWTPTKKTTIGSCLPNEMELNISNNVLLFDGSQLSLVVP